MSHNMFLQTTHIVILNNTTISQDAMFYGADNFNQDLRNWDTSSAKTFVSLVLVP